MTEYLRIKVNISLSDREGLSCKDYAKIETLANLPVPSSLPFLLMVKHWSDASIRYYVKTDRTDNDRGYWLYQWVEPVILVQS